MNASKRTDSPLVQEWRRQPLHWIFQMALLRLMHPLLKNSRRDGLLNRGRSEFHDYTGSCRELGRRLPF